MRSYTTAWLAASLLLATGPVLGQLPGDSARPPAGRPPQRELPPPFVTRQTDLEIPFSVKSAGAADRQPASVRVFISWDRGAAWHLYEEKKPDDGRFRFRPKQDGEFWFATQTVDRSGHTDSPEPRWPQLRLVIDTQKPQLLVQPTVTQSGDLTVAYSVSDATLNPGSLKIEYQDATGSGGPWQPVTLPQSIAASSPGQTSGTARFSPLVSSRQINLRAEVTDAAGNAAYFSQHVTLVAPKPAPSEGIAAAPAHDPSATRWNDPAAPAISPVGEDPAMIARTSPPQEIDNSTGEPSGTQENPYARQDRLVTTSQPAASEYGPATPTEPLSPAAEPLPPPEPNYGNPAEPAYGYPPAEPVPNSPPSYSPDSAYGSDPPVVENPPTYRPTEPESIPPVPGPTNDDRPSYGGQAEPVDSPAGQKPRLANSRRFSLEYDVEAVGPEGLADVELWGTSDGGRTWGRWGSDPDRKSPFDVEVGGEGIYGFRVVIVGKNGLAASAPQNGDSADIWVGIDLTRPTGRLTSAAYGKGDAAGKLDIRWQADDANLAQRPITLAISDRPDGPFTPIAAGLPNTGQYLWEFDPRSPRQIYLRLEVRDDAGNFAIDQLTEPIQVEGLQPKGRIRGFAPASETQRGAFRPPLFR